MKSARPIALWLAAVIVAIAASLMTSGAHAHGGHRHAPRSQPVAAPPADPLVLAGIGADIRVSGSAATVRTGAGTVVEAVRTTLACPTCSAEGVCGQASAFCCAVALAPSPVPGLAPMAARDRARAGDGPHQASIVPEMQAEPPRRPV
ncbi:hypothetical protein [Methylorubrum aminovorans]|uniref:hypothetical protein n=1 Tax=Methylorubrum aminovorans TaxID=269069 RepID=UPI003C300C77